MSDGLDLEGIPLLRTLLTEAVVCDRNVVVSGVAEDWSNAARAVRDAGGKVIGFHAVRKDPAVEHEGLPVAKTVPDVEAPGAPVVAYGTTPKKAWFTAAPPAPQRCLWVKPLEERMMRGKANAGLMAEHSQELAEVHARLADPLSKSIYRSLIKGRIKGDSGYFRISPYPEYEHPNVAARSGQVVVDVGAYDGDTARRYSKRVGPRGRVLALEPSHQNYVKLCANCATERLDNVLPFCWGAGAKQEIASFKEGQKASSSLSAKGELKVPLTTLDHLISLLDLRRVDLIKLDVEGAERDVINGAWEMIEWHRPMLQVSIYHKPNDLFGLPLFLMKRLRNYTYFLGHHSFYHVETDLYCCPNERLALG